MDRLFSDEGIETRQTTVSSAMEQFIDHKESRRHHQSPHVAKEWDDDSNPWDLGGYIECLEHIREYWSHDSDSERIRMWVETVTVLP